MLYYQTVIHYLMCLTYIIINFNLLDKEIFSTFV